MVDKICPCVPVFLFPVKKKKKGKKSSTDFLSGLLQLSCIVLCWNTLLMLSYVATTWQNRLCSEVWSRKMLCWSSLTIVLQLLQIWFLSSATIYLFISIFLFFFFFGHVLAIATLRLHLHGHVMSSFSSRLHFISEMSVEVLNVHYCTGHFGVWCDLNI